MNNFRKSIESLIFLYGKCSEDNWDGEGAEGIRYL